MTPPGWFIPAVVVYIAVLLTFAVFSGNISLGLG